MRRLRRIRVERLLDLDWFGNTVTWDRAMHGRARLEAKTPVPDWVVAVLSDRAFHTFAAKVIVLTEIFIALGARGPAMRYLAVWVAVGFTLAIEARRRSRCSRISRSPHC